MRLLEYEAKEIFRKYGIRTPEGEVCYTPEDARNAVAKLGPSVIKAQVPVGGRGLAGGVRFVNTPDEAYSTASVLLSSSIKGFKPRALLVEKKICIDRELYLSLTIDRSARSLVYLASKIGGVEIEEIVKSRPEVLLKIIIDPLTGYSPYMARNIAVFFGLNQTLWGDLERIVEAMYKIMLDYDAELVEINPLVIECQGSITALDAKIIIDDNSLYRHPEYSHRILMDLVDEERIAREKGFSYVALGGNIGIIGNGAGLTMATMDLVKYYGGSPANFLDVWSGGGASRERVKEAVKLLLENPRIKAILVNIFGGMTRCDEVAVGIREALSETGVKKPIVVRMLGTNREEGVRILREIGLEVYEDIEEAVSLVVKLAGG
ncbi:ADP-forming succinate--CoA ligase subunit beta [Thermogladius sp. 4427co]|uniref:ADP-forming succinate--CoA ligase subunit beta n=1 Tax=Thermogladius sp. 4427co TaxID=3450718 RepID=UPI003F790724